MKPPAVWTTKVVLYLTYFLCGILLKSVGVVVLQSIASFGVSKPEASIIEACKNGAIVCMSFLFASRIPSFGYKKSLLLAFSLMLVATVIMASSATFTATKVFFALSGMAFAFIKVTLYSLVGMVAKNEREHSSLMSLLEACFMGGVLTSFWLFSAFIDPLNPASLSWVDAYWLLSVGCAMLLGLTLFAYIPELAVKPVVSRNILTDFAKMGRLFIKPLVCIFILSLFLYALIEHGVNTWLPTFNKEILHLPSSMSIQTSSILALCLMIGRFSAGVVSRYFNWYFILNACIVAMAGLLLVSMPLASGVVMNENVTWTTAPLAAYVFPMIGLFMAPIYPIVNSTLLSSLPKDYHATMTGLIVLVAAIGGAIGSYIVGQIFALFGGINAFYMTLVPMAGMIVTLFFLKKQISLGFKE